MVYYEIEFYGVGHKEDFTYYLKTKEEFSIRELKEKLLNEFTGVGGLEEHHVENLIKVNKVSAEEFTEYSGLIV